MQPLTSANAQNRTSGARPSERPLTPTCEFSFDVKAYSMQVEILKGDMLIGAASIEHLDPPMGVAFGPFFPSIDYASASHANVIEGEHVGDKGLFLVATANPHGALNASIAIHDYGDLGREMTLFFRDDKTFAALFAAHPDYTIYYPRLVNGG